MERRIVLKGMTGLGAALVGGCEVGAEPGAGATDTARHPVDIDALRSAFYYAFPLYEFARVEQARTDCVGQPGTLNTLRHRSELFGPSWHGVTAPNVDTIYSSAFLELSGGPVEIVAPTDHERYFSIAFMNAFTDNFAYIGTRATGGNGGKFWLCGPSWEGDVPAGVTLIRSDSNDVWMLARILVDGPEDLPAATALQEQIAIGPVPGKGPIRPFRTAASKDFDARQFLSVVSEVLRRSPGGNGQFARASQFGALGISPSPDIRDALCASWDAFIPIGLQELKDTFIFRDLVIDGWAYQEPGVGDFGENDKLRAAVALGGLAALGEEEAMYFHANLDPQGGQLTGEHLYRWRVPPGGVPVDAFWSLTVYEAQPDGRYYLVENPIDRYSIGDRTPGLVVDPDGSFEIYIQKDRPEGDAAANWLPAPEGKMRLALRAYLPRKELQERTWTIPPLVRID